LNATTALESKSRRVSAAWPDHEALPRAIGGYLRIGKSKEAIKPRPQAGPGAGRREQDYEVHYEAKKTKRSAGGVKKAVGSSRRRVERPLGTLGTTDRVGD
jgi:hypothetical protein